MAFFTRDLPHIEHNVSCTHSYTIRTAACTCVYNGHYSRTSSRRERTPSRINGIRKDSQKDVDCSSKALSIDWTASYWVMPRENNYINSALCV